jgi:hypothetical protein
MWFWASVLVTSALLGSCVSSSGGTSRTTPTPSISVSVVAMGTKTQTRAGNDVTVHSFTSSVGATPASAKTTLVAADIDVCATNHPTAVSRTLFFVETADKVLHPAVADVKKPALRAGIVDVNTCTRGWVTFRVPKGKKQTFVVLLSSTIIKWQIP